MTPPKRGPHIILDLFSGCGGMSLGAHFAGFSIALAIDKDPLLSSSYGLNFPGAIPANWDLTRTDKSRINRLVSTKGLDGIIGGPPCQGVSLIGKRDLADRRNHAIAHFFRLVAELRPKFFVMENVPGLLAGDAIKILESALTGLPQCYQVLPPMRLNAKDFGCPTDRERVLVIGYNATHVSKLTEQDFLPPNTSLVTVADAIEDLPHPLALTQKTDFDWRSYPKSEALSDYAKKMRAQPDQGLGWDKSLKMLLSNKCSGFLNTEHALKVINRFRNTEPGTVEKISRYPRLEWNGVSPTLRSGTGPERGSYQSARPLHPARSRVITVREAARLQGFPDWFVFHPTKWHSFRMIGNSVSPLLIRNVLTTIRSKLA